MPQALKDLQCAPLALLAHQINEFQRTLDGYTRNSLRVALDQGDVLAWAKAKIGRRKWKEWREANCPRVKERTDVHYRRLAAHRTRIEQELLINPDLTIPEAVALISTTKSKSVAASKHKKAHINTTTATTMVVAKPAPTMQVPAAPMGDPTRLAIIELALKVGSVARRPHSAPNKEVLLALVREIVSTAKTGPAKTPTLDDALFRKAMAIAA